MPETQNKNASFFAKIKQRLDQVRDSEVEQALHIRVTLAFAIAIYFCLPWQKNETLVEKFFSSPSLVAFIFFLGAILIVTAIIINPVSSPLRRIAGILLDIVSLSFLTYFAGQESVFMFVFYLWVILGNGFRYGTRYLHFSLAVGLLGFSSALLFSDYWQGIERSEIAVSLLLVLLIVPLYTSFLIKKLHAAIASAKEANEAKSRFLANMSHELRTPLNGVTGMADLLSKTELNRQQSEYVNIMKSSAKSLLSLIENVLDISKIEAGKIVIADEQFDLYQLVNTIVMIQAPMGEEKNLTVSCYIDPATPFSLQGDPQHLRQILVNLIGNAIKFTDEGWVKVSIFPVDQTIQTDKSLIRFEIQDSGIGLTYDEIEIIFDDFTQANTTNNNDVAGTGLGTTISKELVHLLGGDIGLESKKNQGSTFWFEVPFTNLSIENLPLTNKKILLLTQNETVKKISPTFDIWNLSYDWASSSARAFSLLMSGVEDGNEYQTLLVEESCIEDIGPENFAQMIRTEPSLEHLALVLIHSKGLKTIRSNFSQLYISELYDLEDSRLLFNAIHAAETAQFESDKVVSLAKFSQNKATSPLNILIAEDNRVNQQVLEGVLQNAGYKCTVVNDGEKALDAFTHNLDKIDLLILDMNLPELTGIEVLQAMQFMNLGTIPVIMLTADATPEAKQNCLDAGASIFLTKPLDSNNLLEQISILTSSLTREKNERKEINRNDGKSSQWAENDILSELALLGGGDKFISQLVMGFKQDGMKHVSIIQTAAKDDYLNFRESVHALKGSAAELGATKLVDLCVQAEQLKPYDVNSNSIMELSAQIEHAFLTTIESIEESLQSSQFDLKPNN